MKRLARLISIFMDLQSHKVVTAGSLAEKYNVSIRTIYRDMDILSDAGIPIGAESSKGYFLVDGFHMAPVSFTLEEASAMLTAEKILSQNSDKSLKDQYSLGMAKIRSVLKAAGKDHLAELEQRIEPSRPDNENFRHNWVIPVQMAISRKEMLGITYEAISTGLSETRDVEPIGIYFTQDNWILVAYCHLRKNWREFRLDRITRMWSLNKKFSRSLTISQYFSLVAGKSTS